MVPLPGTMIRVENLWLGREQIIGPRGEPPTSTLINGYSVKLTPNGYHYTHRLVHLSTFNVETSVCMD